MSDRDYLISQNMYEWSQTTGFQQGSDEYQATEEMLQNVYNKAWAAETVDAKALAKEARTALPEALDYIEDLKGQIEYHVKTHQEVVQLFVDVNNEQRTRIQELEAQVRELESCQHDDPAGFYMTNPPRCVRCGWLKKPKYEGRTLEHAAIEVPGLDEDD